MPEKQGCHLSAGTYLEIESMDPEFGGGGTLAGYNAIESTLLRELILASWKLLVITGHLQVPPGFW